MQFFWVAIGSALGGATRFWISQRWDQPAMSGMPWGTLTVNLIGSLLIGVVLGYVTHSVDVKGSSWLHPLLVTGFLGGFTTFSSFSQHIMVMLEQGAFLRATSYTAVSVFGGVLLAGLGWAVVRQILAN